MSDSAEKGPPAWFTRWSDPVVQTIVQIDRDLASTQYQRDLLRRHSLCLACGATGVHAHVVPAGRADE